MVRYDILVSGRVQGVGFRYLVHQQALLYGLTGWVRNLDNGEVEIEVQGKQEQIEHFLETIRRGTRWIRIDNMRMVQIACRSDENKFRALYS